VERIPPQFATRERVEMVSLSSSYYTPFDPRCGNCNY